MWYALCWFLVLACIALWSLLVWGADALAGWTAANAGVLTGSGGAVLDPLQIPAWLAPWLPPDVARAIASAVSGLQPAVDALLGWLPALAGGVSVVIWTVWAVGTVLLLLIGLAVTTLVTVLRRRLTRQGGHAAQPVRAG